MFGEGDAISIFCPPGPVGPLVLGSAAAQLSPVRLGIGFVRRIQRAGDHNDYMSVRVGVALLRSFQPADDELPGGRAFGGSNPISQWPPVVSVANGIDNVIR